MKKFRMKYIVKEYAIVEVTAEDEEKAKEQILRRANEGEFDGDMVGGDCEFECLEAKDVLSFGELRNKYIDFYRTRTEDTFVRLWNRFVDEDSFFANLKKEKRIDWEWEMHLHENTLDNLKKAFRGNDSYILAAIFDNHNDEGVFHYSQDAKLFIVDENDGIIVEDTVDDMAEHIITGWCWGGDGANSYTDCWRRVMEFFLEHYDEEEEKRMEEARKQIIKED